MASSKARKMAQKRDSKKAVGSTRLAQGDEESCAETLLGDEGLADGELDGPVDGSDEGLETQLGLLKATKRAVPKN